MNPFKISSLNLRPGLHLFRSYPEPWRKLRVMVVEYGALETRGVPAHMPANNHPLWIVPPSSAWSPITDKDLEGWHKYAVVIRDNSGQLVVQPL